MQRLKLKLAMAPLVACAVLAAGPRPVAADTLNLTTDHVLDYPWEGDVSIEMIPTSGQPAAILEIAEGAVVCCGSNLVRAKRQAWIEVTGGTIHGELWGYNLAQLFVSGGTVADSIWLYARSEATVRDGLVGKGIFARYFSQAIVEGGEIGGPLRAHEEASAILRGGSVFEVGTFHDASAQIEGGSVVGAGAEGTGAVSAAGSSNITIHGEEFRVDGEQISGYGDLSLLTPKLAGKLTGVLASGEWLEVYFYHGGADDSKTGSITLLQSEETPPVTTVPADQETVVQDDSFAAQALKVGGNSTLLRLIAGVDPAVGKAMNVYSEGSSSVEMEAGRVAGSLVASEDSNVLMSGGHVGGALYASGSSHIRIEGGRIVGPLYAQGDSEIEIVGLGFEVLGAPIPMGPLSDTSLTRLELIGTLASQEPMRNEVFHNGHDAETTGSITLVLAAEGSPVLNLNDELPHVISDDSQSEYTVQVEGTETSLDLTGSGEIERLFLEGGTDTTFSGVVGNSIITGDASSLSMTGGSIGRDLATYGSSSVEITGGVIAGSIFARNSSVVTLVGTEFRLDRETLSTTEFETLPLPPGELRLREGRIQVSYLSGPPLEADFHHAGADEFSTGTIELSLDDAVTVVLDDDATHVISNDAATYANKRLVVKGNTRVEIRGSLTRVLDVYMEDNSKLFLRAASITNDLVVADTAYVELDLRARIERTLAIYDSGRVRMRGADLPSSFGLSVADNGLFEMMGTNMFVQEGADQKPLDPHYEELDEVSGFLSGILESGDIVFSMYFQRDALDPGSLGVIFTPEPGPGTLYGAALLVLFSLRRMRDSR